MSNAIRLVYDSLNNPAPYTLHPRGRMSVRLFGSTVQIVCPDGHTIDLPLSRVPAFGSLTPRDSGGRKLPLRLQKPLLAKLVGTPAVDVSWSD